MKADEVAAMKIQQTISDAVRMTCNPYTEHPGRSMHFRHLRRPSALPPLVRSPHGDSGTAHFTFDAWRTVIARNSHRRARTESQSRAQRQPCFPLSQLLSLLAEARCDLNRRSTHGKSAA
ncbi:hypothetical protein Bxe_A2586 [Paraburkholderia xenovorans LB400]|uniref:Uncharacterized protein n=1 Tax=Paraburkholderia xenovorans (strain LB400) TaxID=266265 RepID=Q13ZU5_PARXL|nr:hypothetical protein Bxe_A2586 [Paraburkholderia xenovorans LB400]